MAVGTFPYFPKALACSTGNLFIPVAILPFSTQVASFVGFDLLPAANVVVLNVLELVTFWVGSLRIWTDTQCVIKG
jgi:uncharacterized membrane protein